MKRELKNLRAHRVAWELVHGPVPCGLVLDHICENRACVNPAHLEPVTQAVNVQRAHGRRTLPSDWELPSCRRGAVEMLRLRAERLGYEMAPADPVECGCPLCAAEMAS